MSVVCARVVSERIRNRSANIGRAAAPQVELRSTLTGTRCPNRSPAVTDNTPTERRRERGEREMEETGESMKMEEGWRKYGNEIWRLNSEWQGEWWRECRGEMWGSVRPLHLYFFLFGFFKSGCFCAWQNKKKQEREERLEQTETPLIILFHLVSDSSAKHTCKRRSTH